MRLWFDFKIMKLALETIWRVQWLVTFTQSNWAEKFGLGSVPNVSASLKPNK